MKKNCKVERDPAVLYVVKIVFKGFMDSEFTVTAKLPKTGQTPVEQEASATLQWYIGRCDIWHLRAGPDKRHVSDENIQELRKLIRGLFS